MIDQNNAILFKKLFDDLEMNIKFIIGKKVINNRNSIYMI